MVVSDFVEREARRLCFAHSGWKPDTLVADVPALPIGPFGRPVLQHARQVPAWHLYVPLVRSVLEGVKEPTGAMIIAGCAQLAVGGSLREISGDWIDAALDGSEVDAALNAPQEPCLPNPGGIIPYTVERGESVGEAANRALKAAMEAKS